jgi:hypothetical protein
MAIVVIEKTDVNHNFFVVQQMDECLRHPALPFDQFKYQSNKNKQIYVVESGNLHPACVMSVFRLADDPNISGKFVEIPANRFKKNIPMSYEELQEFSNERQSYNAFADDEVINEWGLQRDIEISKIQNGGESRPLIKKRNKIKKQRNLNKRQRIQCHDNEVEDDEQKVEKHDGDDDIDVDEDEQIGDDDDDDNDNHGDGDDDNHDDDDDDNYDDDDDDDDDNYDDDDDDDYNA